MNDFAGMEELLSDFLLEAGEMLSDVDSKLMELEKRPNDSNLLNEVFRGFHTIKGGAGFLNATELDEVCWLVKRDGRTEIHRAKDNEQIAAYVAEGDQLGYLWKQGFFDGVDPQ